MIFIFVIAGGLVAAFVYALITHFIIFLLSLLWPSRLGWIITHKKQSFLALYTIYAILIPILMFIRLDEKGFGDFEKMPVGNGYELTSIDGSLPLLEPASVNGYIDSFAIRRKTLCAIRQKDINGKYQASYIVFKTADKTLLEFADSSAYKEYALSNGLPLPAEFNSFHNNYHKYWSERETWWFPF